MKEGFANLRVSYLGGGYDYPRFFKETPVVILSEGLSVRFIYEQETDKWGRDEWRWESPVGLKLRMDWNRRD